MQSGNKTCKEILHDGAIAHVIVAQIHGRTDVSLTYERFHSSDKLTSGNDHQFADHEQFARHRNRGRRHIDILCAKQNIFSNIGRDEHRTVSWFPNKEYDNSVTHDYHTSLIPE
jgi:hypothetical protein